MNLNNYGNKNGDNITTVSDKGLDKFYIEEDK